MTQLSLAGLPLSDRHQYIVDLVTEYGSLSPDCLKDYSGFSWDILDIIIAQLVNVHIVYVNGTFRLKSAFDSFEMNQCGVADPSIFYSKY